MPRFKAALRIDPLLKMASTSARQALAAAGYSAGPDVDDTALVSARRFIDDSIGRIDPVLPGGVAARDFAWPETARADG